LIRYRPFRNSDPPGLAAIWRTQPPERGLVQPMSADLFEQLVLAKPYFENAGLIVAVDDDLPVGFAHAAFGPREDEQGLSTELGTTCLVMVRANYQRRGIGAELLTHSEAYLRGRGAKVLYAGGIRPLNAFYLGLYGGSELPGVLDSDSKAQCLFKSQGYREIDRCLVFHRTLAGFRPPVDRQQMQVRRRCLFEVVEDPPAKTWWEACTYGGFERTRFELKARTEGTLLASALVWNIEPLASSWGVHAGGLLDVAVDPAHQREGLATFLLSEAFRHLQTQSISLVEVQTMRQNAAAIGLYRKLGFEEIDQGAVYRKAEE
jgi:ribosomal protein S18 acetylase RimI-like enzyme